MSYTVKIGGAEVEVNSLEEVRELLLMGNVPSEEGKKKRYNGEYRVVGAGETKQNTGLDVDQRLLSMLVLLEREKTMIRTRALLKEMGYGSRGLRSFGGVIHALKNRMTEAGLKVDKVLGRTRVGQNYLWVAGPEIKQAIGWLEMKIEEANKAEKKAV